MTKGRLSGIWLAGFLIILIPFFASATTVTNTNDSGGGSLRDAVASTPPGGTVDFDPSLAGSTIVLGSQIVITNDVFIDGPGPGALTISGGGVTRIFNIVGGSNVNISGLRFINGLVTGGGVQLGPAIINQGAFNLTIDNCVFESNNASCNSVGCVTGGAVTQAIAGGALISVSNSVFRKNRATCSGDACIALGSGLANGSGGDVDITVNNSTFFQNTTVAECPNTCIALGAGYGNGGGGTDVRSLLFNSTFELNSSSCSGTFCIAIGSGVTNGGGGTFFQLINNTLYANRATCSGDNCAAQGAGFGNGGGGATADILFNTFSGNSVTCDGSACTANGASISSSIDSQINIDSNILFTESPAGNCSQIFTSLGYNIDNGDTCIDGSAPGDQPFTDPGLVPGPPVDNGGPTPTIALLPTSPAIDAGNPACPPPDTDQRGVPRPQNVSCDAGSYELAPLPVRNIPTLTEWGMIAAAAGFGLIGVFAARRKRVRAA